MNDTTPTARPRIDAARIDEWRNEALAAARDGMHEREIEAWLKGEGCPPRTRGEIVAQARGARRTHHRGAGLKAFLLGLGVCAAGAAMLVFGLVGVPVGDHLRAYSPRFLLAGAAFVALGMPPLVYGLYKTLTGSQTVPRVFTG
ncbi:MAG: hypothetical protein ABJD97_13160 [Betaproteobacteria bacterium]